MDSETPSATGKPEDAPKTRRPKSVYARKRAAPSADEKTEAPARETAPQTPAMKKPPALVAGTPAVTEAPPKKEASASDAKPRESKPTKSPSPAKSPPPRKDSIAKAAAINLHKSPPPPAQEAASSFDVQTFSQNMARVVEEGSKAFAAYMKPREQGKIKDHPAESFADVAKTLGHVMEYWMADPQRAVKMQASLGKAYLDLWANALRRMSGEPVAPVAEPDPRDKRFSDPEWKTNQFFDFLKQLYLVTSHWANNLVDEAKGLHPHTRHKAEFYMRQLINALAPSNFVLTNPELLRTTLSSNAENLVRGMQMLKEDIEAGGGDLKIRQSDASKFEVGRTLGLTPGKVIYQNDVMQLIQYAPSTKTVLKTPLLIVPPWINKFYILDLTPEKSFIKWCVDQGLTVFCISWVNPDSRLAAKTFADYMHEGPLEALDVIIKATGEKKVNTIGYCVGGTMLAATLAYMAAKGDDRVASATMFTAQVDFTHGGDLKVFASDEQQLEALERRMAELGYLEGKKMGMVFNLLRANDLVWPYIISNYLKGEQPFPFDLLYWNSDSTRMPAANHSFYLRSCYLENRLSKGTMELDGERLDLSKSKVPIYNLATREDHIAPVKSVYLSSSFFGGPVRFVVAGSGHIAGIVNPPAKQKYQYWTGDPPKGDDVEGWLTRAKESPGSWWPDWVAWIKKQDGGEVDAREPGCGKYQPIEDAPGSYVKVQD
jgi:polyhydroxyalkanoate synthase